MTLDDNIFLVFIGILVSDIVYQSAILQKIYKEIEHVKSRLIKVEEHIKR
jgi:hypothetical protein